MIKFFSFLFIVGCVTTPVTQRKAFNIVPDARMNEMGEQAYQEILQKEKISTDKNINAVVEKIGRRIADASGADFKWEFKVIDADKVVNAFCLPGGKVAVYTGILPVAKSHAGLAAVMGHEVAHAILRHGAERMSQQIAIQLGVNLASLSFKDPNQRGLIAAGLGVGAQFGVLLPFSRKHESEADLVGLQYMAKAGYDPKEAVTLWERMAKEGGSRPPELLSTHPDPERRARDLEQQLGKVQDDYQASEKQPPEKL